MADESSQLAGAASCNSDAENDKPGAKQNCSDIVNISVFFDGTGNNYDVDEKVHRWSNPARLWRAAQALTGPKTTNYAFYISGVGTEYNGYQGKTPTFWEENDAAVEDAAFGNGFGQGGTRRTKFGQGNVNDALRQALLDNAKKFNAVTKAYVAKSKNASLGEINTALKPFNLISVINLSVFGFSRGAALARAFVNDFLKEQCKMHSDGKIYFNEHLLKIKFLGLFDTVASFGLPSVNIDAPFFEKNLVVPDCVENCVHLIAGHEIRFSFPVDIISKGGKYRPNWIELVYPGVHSDVGGGYDKVVQGISNNYSRIPMRKMMRVATKAGVRMLDFDTMAVDRPLLYQERFLIHPETEARFKNYMAAVNPPDAIGGAVAAHMKALYSGWGTMTRKKITTPDLIATKDSTAYNLIGHIGIAEEAELLLRPFKAMGAITDKALHDSGLRLLQVAGLAYAQVVRPEPWRLIAWRTDCSDAVLQFIQHSVHDSKAAFICSVEPFSYFRPRGMAESSRNVLARGLDWLDNTASTVKKVTFKIIYDTGQIINDTGVVVVQTLHDGVLFATKKYKLAEKFVLEKSIAGATYTIEIVQAGSKVVISTMEATGRYIVTSAVAAKRKTGEFIDATQKKAGEAADATKKSVGEFADATKKNVGDFADATQKKGGELLDAASKKTGQLADSAGKSAIEFGQKVQSGASDVGRGVGSAYDAGVKTVAENWTGAMSALGL